MSMEFGSATHPITTDMAIEVIKNLAHSASSWIEVLEYDGRNALFRFLEIPKRTQWIEDVTLEFTHDQIYVAFHTGNKRLWMTFLAELITSLNEQGISADFHEI